jgi:hypothetical protein
LYIAVGTIGFVYHFPSFHGQGAFQTEDIWIELTEGVAAVSGVFLLRGENWARWLAFAWIVFHVLLSVFHPIRELAIHLAMCLVIGWILFSRAAGDYFRRGPEKGRAG